MVGFSVRTIAGAVCVFMAASSALAFTRFEGGVAMLWPACGVLAGLLDAKEMRQWPPVLIASGVALAIATALFGVSGASLLLTPASLVEPVLIVIGLRALHQRFGAHGHKRQLFQFLIVAGVAAPGLTALYGATMIHLLTGQPWGVLAFDWYAAHALGDIIVMPVMIGLHDLPGRIRNATPTMRRNTCGLLVVLAAVASLTFWQASYPLLVMPILPLTLIAFVLGMAGTSAAMLLLALIGGIGTAQGLGPLALMHGSAGLHSQFFQLYLATAGLIAFSVATEIGRRNALAIALRRSEASYRLLADRSGDVLLRLNVDGTIDYASPALETIGGIRTEAVTGRSAADLVMEEDRAAVVAAHRAAIVNPDQTRAVEYRYRHPDGRLLWLETHTRAYCDEDGRVAGVVSAIRDISQRKATETELLWEATTDPLTGIGNRRAFERALARAIETEADGGPGGCIAIFDIDNFKRVNDSLGHDAGDKVIRTLAEVLRRSLREGDIAARLGGEEFGLILVGVDEARAAIVCERVRRAFGKSPVMHAGGVIACKSVSAGLCAIGRTSDPVALVRMADEALYRAKRGGRDRLEIAA